MVDDRDVRNVMLRQRCFHPSRASCSDGGCRRFTICSTNTSTRQSSKTLWNDRIDAPRPSPDNRFGTRIAEAYAYSLIANHYHAWVYHFKIEYPSNTLLTEYEKIEHHEDQRDDNDQQEIEIKLFCGDLDLAECEISVSNERNDDF
jgi:hypothetical protein